MFLRVHSQANRSGVRLECLGQVDLKQAGLLLWLLVWYKTKNSKQKKSQKMESGQV